MSLFILAFARHVARREEPQVEKMSHWPPSILARLRRGRPGAEGMTDRCTENWNDP